MQTRNNTASLPTQRERTHWQLIRGSSEKRWAFLDSSSLLGQKTKSEPFRSEDRKFDAFLVETLNRLRRGVRPTVGTSVHFCGCPLLFSASHLRWWLPMSLLMIRYNIRLDGDNFYWTFHYIPSQIDIESLNLRHVVMHGGFRKQSEDGMEQFPNGQTDKVS